MNLKTNGSVDIVCNNFLMKSDTVLHNACLVRVSIKYHLMDGILFTKIRLVIAFRHVILDTKASSSHHCDYL